MAFGIVKSLLVTFAVSSLVTVILYFMGFPPLKTFTIIIISLFILGFFLGQISETLAAINNKKLENDRIAEFAKQGVLIECAYCEQPNFVPIRFDIKNEFVCESCNKSNAVYVDILASRTTEPLQGDPMQIQTINTEEEEAINKIKNG